MADLYKLYYQCDIFGNVWSMRRDKILKQKNVKGYMKIEWSLHDKPKQIFVHRFVAETFTPNPDNKPFINHKNGIKDDNMAENLEWCTAKENTKHAYDSGLQSMKHAEKKVYQYTLDNELVAEYGSSTDAYIATGVGGRNIRTVASGTPSHGYKRKSAGNFKWSYVKLGGV
jgi:hypothetical protein